MPLSNEALREAIAERRLYIHPKPSWPVDYDTDSVHLHLGREFYVLREGALYKWDPHKESITQFWKKYGKKIILKPGEIFWLNPGCIALAETQEVVGLPQRHRKRWAGRRLLSGKLDGRSRYARAFVGIHVTARVIHPGTQHRITGELHNVGPIAVAFRVGDPIFQLQCEEVIGKVQPIADSFANGQTSAIGEKRLPSNVVRLLVRKHKRAGRHAAIAGEWRRGKRKRFRTR